MPDPLLLTIRQALEQLSNREPRARVETGPRVPIEAPRSYGLEGPAVAVYARAERDEEILVRALAACDALDARTAAGDRALVIVSAYYAYHAEDDEPACPCEPCEKARAHFALMLREMDANA